MATPDPIDAIIGQWRAQRPELELRPMALIGRLARVVGLIERRVAATLDCHDLAIADFDVLAALRRAGAPHRLTPTQLYRGLMLTSGTITNRIDRLEARGLVERREDPADRRGTLVALTAKGLAAVDAAVVDHLATESRIVAALTRAEQATLDVLLRKLYAGMVAAEAPPSLPRGRARSGGGRR